MQVQWYSFLQQLGAQCSDDISAYHGCPLHPNLREPTLRVYTHPATRCYHFRCIHSKCQFNGDAVQLLAHVKGLSIEDAAFAFAKTPYADCLEDSLLENQIQDYLDDYTGQAQIRAYLERCNDMIFSGKGAGIRKRIAHAGVTDRPRWLPKGLCAVDPIDPPKALAVLGKPSFRKGQFLLFPYSFEGQITQVITQQIDITGELGQPQTHKLDPCGLGVFPVEHLETKEDYLLICESTLLTCKLTKLWCNGRNATPPIINPLDFPLPRECAGKSLHLMDTIDHPLSLEYALRAYAAKELVLGENKSKINVVPRKHPWNEANIKNKSTLRNYPVPLRRWIVESIIQHAKEDQADRILEALQHSELTVDLREQLVSDLTSANAPNSVVQMVTDSHLYSRGELRLANNMRILKRTDGMYGKSVRSTDTRLSNTLIRVDSRIVTAKREVIYACSFKHKDAGAVRGRLTSADIGSADKLQKAISYCFTSGVDRAPYIACYEGGKNYKWRDIINKLAEGAPTYREAAQLGIDENLHIQLPHFMLDLTQNALKPQERIFTLSRDVLDCYAGLLPAEDGAQALETTRTILRNCDNMYVGGFVAGLCQMIFTLISARHAQTRGRTPPRVHLCYAEPVDGIWSATFDNLNMLFSDSANVPHIETNAKEHLGRMTELGPLPYLAYLPPWVGSRIPSLFHDSPVNLITRIDGGGATNLNHEPAIGFILPPDYKAADPNAIHPSDVLQLQRALPELMRFLFKQEIGPELLRDEVRRPTRPAYITYLFLCEALGVAPQPLMNEMIDEYYTALHIGSVQAFCAGLNQILYRDSEFKWQNPYGCEIIEGAPLPEMLASKTPPIAFVMNDVVLLNKRSVHVVAKVTRDDALNVGPLTEELRRQNYLCECPAGVDIDVNSYWTIDRLMWDKYIKQERLILTKTVRSGETLTLARLIA
jgi:hypothetical protein